MKKFFAATLALALLVSVGSAFAAVSAETVTGEVVERACFIDRGARGEEHAACAKSCFERGGDVGLVTADGELYILRPAEDAEAFEATKAFAGMMATVTGELSEEDGHKIITVTASGEATS